MIRRTFVVVSEAWYAKTSLRGKDFMDELNILIHDDDQLIGEFMVRWYRLNGIAPKLEVFNDAWTALAMCADFTQCLADYNKVDITAIFLADELRALGFEDVTPRTNPYEDED